MSISRRTNQKLSSVIKEPLNRTIIANYYIQQERKISLFGHLAVSNTDISHVKILLKQAYMYTCKISDKAILYNLGQFLSETTPSNTDPVWSWSRKTTTQLARDAPVIWRVADHGVVDDERRWPAAVRIDGIFYAHTDQNISEINQVHSKTQTKKSLKQYTHKMSTRLVKTDRLQQTAMKNKHTQPGSRPRLWLNLDMMM